MTAEKHMSAPRWNRLSSRVQESQLFAKVKRVGARLPLVRHVVAMWYALSDRATPAAAKAKIAFALGYFVLPFDVIPDFLAGLGYVDDLAVIMATLRVLGSIVKPDHYARADASLCNLGKAGAIATQGGKR